MKSASTVLNSNEEGTASGAAGPLRRLSIPVEMADREQYIDALFRDHYDRVARWCQRFANDRASAADLAQEVFAKAYQKLDSFRGNSSFSTWLYAIARNHCLNAVRSNAWSTNRELGEIHLERIPDPGDSPYTTLERESAREQVWRLLDENLNETEKVVFTLHFGEDVPLQAINSLLGLRNRSGARAHIVSAKRKLKRLAEHHRSRRARENRMAAVA